MENKRVPLTERNLSEEQMKKLMEKAKVLAKKLNSQKLSKTKIEAIEE